MIAYLHPSCRCSRTANYNLCRDTPRQSTYVCTCLRCSVHRQPNCETWTDSRPTSSSCPSPAEPTCKALSSNRCHQKPCNRIACRRIPCTFSAKHTHALSSDTIDPGYFSAFSGFRTWGVNQPLGVPSLSALPLHFPFLFSPLLPSLPTHHSAPLSVGSGEEPQPKLNLVHFGLKI